MSIFKEPKEWLIQAIDSILNQTFTDFEFIIICDNPEYKEGISIIENYSKKDERVKLIFNQTNLGLTKSLNIGLSLAQGE
jgi:glycosyltransferase involved in cell wall biosynthesis